MSTYKFHQAASIYPLLELNELNELADDIEAFGLKSPIQIHDEKIIDGRNRYTACRLRGIRPEFVDADVGEQHPLEFVRSMNERRRDLTTSQRAMAAARSREIYDREANERQGARTDIPANLPECPGGDSRDKAGKDFGVGGRTVEHASRVVRQGTKELNQAVDSKAIVVSKASEIAGKSPDEQNAIVSRIRSGEKSADVLRSLKPPKSTSESHGNNGKATIVASADNCASDARGEFFSIIKRLADDGIYTKASLIEIDGLTKQNVKWFLVACEVCPHIDVLRTFGKKNLQQFAFRFNDEYANVWDRVAKLGDRIGTRPTSNEHDRRDANELKKILDSN